MKAAAWGLGAFIIGVAIAILILALGVALQITLG